MQTNSEYQNQLLADGLIIKLVLVPLSHETDVGQWNRVFQVKQVGYQSFSFCDTLYIWDSETECNISDCLLQCYTCYSVTDEICGTVSQVSQASIVGQWDRQHHQGKSEICSLTLILKKLRHLRASARLCLWEAPYKHVVRHAVTQHPPSPLAPRGGAVCDRYLSKTF